MTALSAVAGYYENISIADLMFSASTFREGELVWDKMRFCRLKLKQNRLLHVLKSSKTTKYLLTYRSLYKMFGQLSLGTCHCVKYCEN